MIRKISGKPLFYFTYNQSKKSKLISNHFVATDDDLIINECKKLNVNYIKTSKKHKTGTDRIAECLKKIDADIYVNIQGDEPMVNPRSIDKVINCLKNNTDNSASTAYAEINTEKELINKNVVKIVVNSSNDAVYLSRSKIPFNYNNNVNLKFFKHLGLYAFKKDALEAYKKNKQGILEQNESIELLRLLENNYKVKCVKIKNHLRSVDTLEDFKFIKRLIQNEKTDN